MLRERRRTEMHAAPVQSAGGNLRKILGAGKARAPAVHPGRQSPSGALSDGGGAKDRRGRLRGRYARTDGAIPRHEPERAFAPAWRDAAGGPGRAAPGLAPASGAGRTGK